MQKQAPSLGNILVMAGFALSCFALLLFLWLSFGGPIPLKPKGYRVQVAFPEATQLAAEADVRIAGVTVGKVREKARDPRGNRTLATLELERRYAPIASDARAILRQKTLLGETYVELTPGTEKAPPLEEGAQLANERVAPTVELDEILDTLDPFTREAFRTWQQDLSVAVRGRSQDLNDSLGNLPGFLQEGGDLMAVLEEERGAVRGLVRNTGVVFEALSRREDQLQALVRNSDDVFTAIQREREAFADTWQIFPTFLDESKATVQRLETFSRNATPLMRDLAPAMEDLGPTLQDVGDLGPDMERFFTRLGPLIDVSEKSLPATGQVLDGLAPLLTELGGFLGQVNPLLDWIAQHQHTLTDVFANLGVATAARAPSGDPQARGHYLRQFSPAGAETLAMHPNRLSSNRGNAYLNPLGVLASPAGAESGILPSFDCANAGGEKPSGGTPSAPACREQQPFRFRGAGDRFPKVREAQYDDGG